MENKLTAAIFLSILISFTSKSQSFGDYRTKQSGNWSLTSSWQTYNGTSWIDATTAPSSASGAITILFTHTITANSNITADQVVINTGGALTITSNTFTVNNGAGMDLLNNGTLTVSGGTQNGSGLVETTPGSTFNWTGGFYGGTGNTKIDAGATFTMSGSSHYLSDSVTINNYGNWTWTSGNLYYYNSSPTVNNYGAFNINTDDNVDRSNATTGTFVNKASGIITKTGSLSNDTYFSNLSSFTNDGTINIDSGVISMVAKYINTGMVNIGIKGTLNFTGGGTGVINAGSVLTGSGNINVNNSTDSILATNISVKNINITSGTLVVMSSFAIRNGNALTLSNGSVSGTGTLTFSPGSTFNWSGGYLNQGGVITIASGAAFNMSGNGHYLADTRTVNNSGTWAWTGGNLYYNGSPAVNNYGTFNISTDDNVDRSGTNTGTFVNQPGGVINKTGSLSNDTYFSNFTSFTNAGTINIDSGTLSFVTKYINTGMVNLSTTGTLNFTSGGTAVLNAGSVIKGTGTINVNNSTDSILTANVTANAINITAGTLTLLSSLTISSGSAVNLSNGTLNGTGDITFGAGSAFNWSGGNLSQGGTLTISAGATLTMSGNTHNIGDTRTLINSGIWTWTGGNFSYYNGSPVVRNNGTFNISTDNDITGSNGTTGTFTNQASGIINKIGSPEDYTYVNSIASFTNAGTININSSLLRTYIKYVNSGTINISFGAGMKFTGGTGSFNSGSALSGEGTLTFDGGTDSINAATISLDNITVASGTLTVKPAIAMNAGTVLTLSGGTLNGTGAWNFNSGSSFLWTGGTLGGSGSTTIKAGANLTVNGGGYVYLADTRTLSNAGTWVWNNGTIIFNGGSPAVTNSGTFNINTDDDISGSNGTTGTFTNQAAGIINKTGSLSDYTYINSISGFNNAGIININSGALRVYTKHTNTKTLNVALGANLSFTNNGGSFSGASVIKGNGSLTFDGAVDTINAATVTIKKITVSAGTVTVAPAVTMASGSILTLSGGTLNGTGAWNFNSGSSFLWTGGTLGGSGSTTIKAGANLTVKGNVNLTDTRSLNNAGTWKWNDGAISFYGGSPAVTNSGTLNINSDDAITGSNGTTGTFTNQASGIINKIGSFSSSTYISSIGAFSNAGTVNINSGTLALNVSGTHTGPYNVALGGQLSGSVSMIYSGTTFTNNGSVTLSGLSFSNTTPQLLNGQGSIKAVTVNNAAGITLGGTQTITSSLSLTNGNITLGGNDLVLGSSSLTGGSSGSFIITGDSGSLQRRINNNNTAVLFPVGAVSYMPATISFTSASVGDDVKIRVLPNMYSDYTANNIPSGSKITASSVNGTWLISENNPGNSVATVSLQWNSSDEAAGFTRPGSRMAHYLNGTWALDAAVNPTGSGPYALSTTGITVFSPLAVTNQFVTNTTQYNNLCSGSNVTVPYTAVGNFITGNKFTAQLSDATGSFASVQDIGSVTSTVSGTISGTIPSSASGTGYRIRVVSTSPSFAASDNGSNISIGSCAKPAFRNSTIAATSDIKQQLTVYPNPTRGRVVVHLQTEERVTGKAMIEMFAIDGRKVYSSVEPVTGHELNKVIMLDNTLSNGFYILKINVGNHAFAERILYSK